MDVRTTLAFTRPRELARLYSVCGCGLDCIFTHSCRRQVCRSVTGARSACPQ
uniref:Putative ACR protein n=1 Tax=Myoviridae sp. ctLnO19 TaxID=2825085 RepID=A0A8S5P0B8_9CAUD|nr:MAG TPA: putative ACR protein [Myoviridae sp. ctLnO19]